MTEQGEDAIANTAASADIGRVPVEEIAARVKAAMEQVERDKAARAAELAAQPALPIFGPDPTPASPPVATTPKHPSPVAAVPAPGTGLLSGTPTIETAPRPATKPAGYEWEELAPWIAAAGTLALAAVAACLMGDRLMRKVRQRAALVICMGLGIIALNLTILPAHPRWSRGFAGDVISDGWLMLFGAAISLVGIYKWISEDPPKI